MLASKHPSLFSTPEPDNDGPITNQDEVTRLREQCFNKHGCGGFWSPDYSTLKLDILVNLLQAKRNTNLTKTIAALKRLA